MNIYLNRKKFILKIITTLNHFSELKKVVQKAKYTLYTTNHLFIIKFHQKMFQLTKPIVQQYGCYDQ